MEPDLAGRCGRKAETQITALATDPDSLLHDSVRRIDHYAIGQKTIHVSNTTSLTSVNFSGDQVFIFNAFHAASTCTLTDIGGPTQTHLLVHLPSGRCIRSKLGGF